MIVVNLFSDDAALKEMTGSYLFNQLKQEGIDTRIYNYVNDSFVDEVNRLQEWKIDGCEVVINFIPLLQHIYEHDRKNYSDYRMYIFNFNNMNYFIKDDTAKSAFRDCLEYEFCVIYLEGFGIRFCDEIVKRVRKEIIDGKKV